MPSKEKPKEKEKQRPHDIFIRLPENKKYLKQELIKIAKEYDLPLSRIMLDAIEYYLKRRKKRTFDI